MLNEKERFAFNETHQRFCQFDPECGCSEEESCAGCLHGCSGSQTHVRDMLRLLAEVYFISAEVCAY